MESACGLPFDMITMLGFLILLGTVVNNPILVVDRTRELLRDRRCPCSRPCDRPSASRLRPILMTTLTTVFGLAPLVLIRGPEPNSTAAWRRSAVRAHLLDDRHADVPAVRGWSNCWQTRRPSSGT